MSQSSGRGVVGRVDFSHRPNAGFAANERFDPDDAMTEHIIVSCSSLGKPVAHQGPLSIRLFFPMVPSWFWATPSTAGAESTVISLCAAMAGNS